MYWLDSAILGVLALAAVLGARTGFLVQAARLVALGVGLYGAVRLNDRVTPLLQQSLLADAPEWAARAVSYVAVFLVIYAAIISLTLLLDRGARAGRTRWLDRALGALLGAFKAGLLLGLAVLALAAFAPDLSEEWLGRSSVAPRLGAGVQGLFEALPAACRDGLQAQLRAAVGREE